MKPAYYLIFYLLPIFLLNAREENSDFPEKDHVQIVRWMYFIEKLHESSERIPQPFAPVETLIRDYLGVGEAGVILDVGCETGKNAVPLIEAGYSVLLLDIAPNAIFYTEKNIESLGLRDGIFGSINEKIEKLNPTYGPFKAVVGTYAFSFIPPHLFDEVMRKNVLGRIEIGGYFAGGFFGKHHVWASDPALSVCSIKQLEALFLSSGFILCDIQKRKKEVPTVFDGKQVFHTIEVIAKRVFPVS